MASIVVHDVQALKEEQQKVMAELKEQLAAAKATQSSTEDTLARADKAEQMTKQLQQQLQSSEETSSGKLAQLASKLKDIEVQNKVCFDILQANQYEACWQARHDTSSHVGFLDPQSKAIAGKSWLQGKITSSAEALMESVLAIASASCHIADGAPAEVNSACNGICLLMVPGSMAAHNHVRSQTHCRAEVIVEET